jgi:hypothetical protein
MSWTNKPEEQKSEPKRNGSGFESLDKTTQANLVELQKKKEELQRQNANKMSRANKGLTFLKGLLPQGWQRMVMQEISNGLQADGVTEATLRTDENGKIQVTLKMDGAWYPEVPLIEAFSFKETDMRKLMYDKYPEGPPPPQLPADGTIEPAKAIE